MAKRIERKRSKPAAPPSMTGPALYVLDRALAIAAVVVVGALLYLMQSLISGAAGAFPQTLDGETMSRAMRGDFLHGIRTAAYILLAGLWGITVVSMFRFRENDVAGWVGVVGGLLCYFALPLIVRNMLLSQHYNPNAATDLMLGAFRATGKVLLLTTVAYFAVKMVLRVASRPSRAPASSAVIIESQPQPAAEQPSEAQPSARRRRVATQRRSTFLRQCWELSMCRGTLRENCPSYKLGISCWKRGTGCQCDPVLAQHLIRDLERRLRGETPEQERVAAERMKEQLAYKLREHQGNAFCRECPIYNEHQYYKYKALFWIAYPVTAGLVFVLLPVITAAYRWVDGALTALLNSLALLPSTSEALGPYMSPVYDFNGEIIFIISAALIIAAYLLDLMDYAVFRAKI